jgi:hypothetical protein
MDTGLDDVEHNLFPEVGAISESMTTTGGIVRPRQVSLFVLFAVVLLATPAHAQETVRAQLSEQNDSGVGGTATFSFTHPDTRALVELKGLDPGATARITVHAGGCSRPSASFVALPDVSADAKGNATADGLLLFQGREAVELNTIADGEHSISVAQGDRALACGEVPKLGQAAAEPDDISSEPPWIPIAGILTIVVLAAAAILAMRRAV